MALPWVYDPEAEPADEDETGAQLDPHGRTGSRSRSRSRTRSRSGSDTNGTAEKDVIPAPHNILDIELPKDDEPKKNSRERRREEREKKDKDRDRDRERDRDRSRERRRRRSRSRSRLRERRRSSSRRRSRSRSRSPWRWRRSRSRDRDRSRERDRRRSSRERDRERRRSPPGPTPNTKCVIPNLPTDIDKDILTIALAKLGYLPQSVRVVNKFDRGTMRSIAFVDFEDVAAAKACMEQIKGFISLPDGRTIPLEYCKYDTGGPMQSGGNSGIGSNALGGTFGDWNCVKCGCNNFTKRENCYQCQSHRSETIEAERSGLAHVGAMPTDTVLVRELPQRCSEQLLTDSLMAAGLKLEIVRVKMADSKRFGLVQLKSVEEASRLLNAFNKAPLVISGQTVIMTYAKDSLGKLLASKLVLQTLESLSGERERDRAASRNMQGGCQTDATLSAADVAQRALQKAVLMRQVAEGVIGQTSSVGVSPNVLKPQYPIQSPARPSPQMPTLTAFPNFSVPPPSVGNPYSVPPPGYGVQPAFPQMPPGYGPPTSAGAAQSAFPSGAAVPHLMTAPPPVLGGVLGSVETPKGTMKKYISPNPSSFTMDPGGSGYYLDPVTNFYYDPQTGYYYNAQISQWTRWDAVFCTYFPVEDTSKKEEVEDTGKKKNGASADDTKEAKKEEQPKSAADVAKEMLKWQKKTEKQKVSLSLKTPTGPKFLDTKSAFGKIAKKDRETRLVFNVDEDDDDEEESKKESAPALPAAALANSGAASREAAKKREELEASLVDEASKTCLLCRRAFKTVEILQKHVQMSDLHKKNLEAKRLEWGMEYVASTAAGSAPSSKSGADAPTKFAQEFAALHAAQAAAANEQKIQYRDRAKERRNQYGLDIPGTEGERPEGGPSTSAPAATMKTPIDATNIGNRLLKNMGWQEGQGVGKHNQGIVNPIEADRRVQGAGLGAAGSKILHGVNATHKERVHAVFANKFRELQDR